MIELALVPAISAVKLLQWGCLPSPPSDKLLTCVPGRPAAAGGGPEGALGGCQGGALGGEGQSTYLLNLSTQSNQFTPSTPGGHKVPHVGQQAGKGGMGYYGRLQAIVD